MNYKRHFPFTRDASYRSLSKGKVEAEGGDNEVTVTQYDPTVTLLSAKRFEDLGLYVHQVHCCIIMSGVRSCSMLFMLPNSLNHLKFKRKRCLSF